MSNESPPKKFKRPKLKTPATTNPEAPKTVSNRDEDRSECHEQVFPLLAKDSEWVDIMQTPIADAHAPSSSNVGDDEAILQLVDCEDGPETKPIAIMFPGLVERDPQTLEGMLNKAMSTTEVTRNLVGLGEKADFTHMKKSNRLIPQDKKWLESILEHSSVESDFYRSSFSSEYEADTEHEDRRSSMPRKKKMHNKRVLTIRSQDSFMQHEHDGDVKSSTSSSMAINDRCESEIAEPNRNLEKSR